MHAFLASILFYPISLAVIHGFTPLTPTLPGPSPNSSSTPTYIERDPVDNPIPVLDRHPVVDPTPVTPERVSPSNPSSEVPSVPPVVPDLPQSPTFAMPPVIPDSPQSPTFETPPSSPVVPEPTTPRSFEPRRSTRVRKPPDRFGYDKF